MNASDPMGLEELSGKTVPELKAILKSLGGSIGGTPKPETIIKRILALQATQAPSSPQTPPESSPNESLAHINTKDANSIVAAIMPKPPEPAKAIGGRSQDEVLKAIQPHIAKGMQVTFDDNSWTFRRGQRMDSGTMSQPLYNIIKCADMVCQASIMADRILKGPMDA